MPMMKPSTVPRAIGIAASRHSCAVRQQLAQLRRDHLADRVVARRREDFAEAEQADRDRHDADAVAELGEVEAVAEVPGHVVDADHAEQQPEAGHQQRAHQRRRRHVGEEDQAEHEQRGVFRRAEAQRERRQRRRHQVSTMTPKVPAIQEPTAAMQSAAPARPFLRHRVAVDAGHHRGRFARNAHQDRGGRAAILRAVIDAGEHDDRLRGVEPERHRQQDARCRRAGRCRAARRPACRPGSRETRTRDWPAATRPRSRAAG